MSLRDLHVRLEDILEAICNIQTYVAGMTYEQFSVDTKTVRAAAYEVVIIGEAARQISEEVKTKYPQIPWDKMQAMRNIIVHEYFRVDVPTLWQTITQNLPPLVPLLQEILEQKNET